MATLKAVSRETDSPPDPPVRALGMRIADTPRQALRGIGKYIVSMVVKPIPAPISAIEVTTEAWVCVKRFEEKLGHEIAEPMRSRFLDSVEATIRRVADKARVAP